MAVACRWISAREKDERYVVMVGIGRGVCDIGDRLSIVLKCI